MKDTTRRSLLAAGGALAIGSVAVADQKASSANSTQQNESESMPEDSKPKNLVRVAHLAPDVGTVGITANDARARGLESVEQLTSSDYTTYQPNAEYDISVHEGDEVVLETPVSLETGPVTLALVGEQCTQSERPLQLLTLSDDYSDTQEGMARMQTVHASPDAPTFDIRTDDGEQVVSGLSFGDAAMSGISAGEHIVGVYTSEDDDPLFRFEVPFEEGTFYTVYAVGYVDLSNAPSSVPDDFSFALGVSGGSEPQQQ